MTRGAAHVRITHWLVGATALATALSVSAQPNQPAQQETDPAKIIAAARPRAVELVLVSARSDDPFRRANAMEAAQHAGERATPLVQLGMQDPHPAVRFAALVAVGSLKLEPLSASARRLLDDPSQSVRAAAMFALRRCGQKVDITPMAAMLVSQNPALRGNVAMLLGRLGDPSAVPLLLESAKAPMPRVSAVREAIVRLQVAEAVLRLGDDSALDALRAAAYSPFDEVRVLAIQVMGRLHDERMTRAIEELLAKPPAEVQLAAAEALARMGKPDGKATTLNACGSTLPVVRAQAAMTVALFRDDAAAARALVGLLADADEQVRLAAAAAILEVSGPG
jgi:HEAT repeat protein